jgi:predicted dehydrogenase
MEDPVRWGILGTAAIAREAFLPALARAGGGVAQVVGSRDGARAQRFAQAAGVTRGVGGYAAVLEDPEVEAVYIPLPNALHAEWTMAALEAGKAVLCEKPLCASPEETEQVLAVARRTGRPLWEAFVFPFHQQMDQLQAWLAEGAIGTLQEIHSSFHFRLEDPGDIRLSLPLAGGALNDLGCYPVRLARLLFGAEAIGAAARARFLPDGVDVELWGVVDFPGDRRLFLSCGLRWDGLPFTRLIGTAGEIRLSHPYHPRARDRLERIRGEEVLIRHPTPDEPSFTAALRHIHEVVRGRAQPRHLAVEDALGNARALELLRQSARQAASPGQ